MGKVYFNDANFPEMENEYVLWVDIMGTKNNMSSSVRTSSIFICKLHVAIMEAKTECIHVYPMMDGAYVTAKSEKGMSKFIKKMFYPHRLRRNIGAEILLRLLFLLGRA